MRSIRSLLIGFSAFVTLLAFGAGAEASATLYRWVDADGITHYSDRPAPGSEKVQIASAQTYKSTPVNSTQPRKAAGSAATAFKYTRLEVTQPTEGQAFVNNGGHVDAAAVIEPDLLGGHQVWFVLDGTRQPESAGLSMSFQVDRGTHTLQAVIRNSGGELMCQTPGVSIAVRQNSILNPNNPNNVRPRPH